MKTLEEIKAKKLRELRLKYLEMQKNTAVSMLFEKNKDSIKMTFRMQKNGSVIPTGFDVKVYGDFDDIRGMEGKLTEAILLGFRKMDSI